MQLWRATLADTDALAAIRRDAILGLTTPVLTRQQAARWALDAPPDRFVRAVRDHAVWLAVELQPVGWVEVDGDHIAALYVSPAHASRGVGSVLLAHAEATIRCAGALVASLEASPNALPFYLRRGYHPRGAPDADGAWPLHKLLICGR